MMKKQSINIMDQNGKEIYERDILHDMVTGATIAVEKDEITQKLNVLWKTETNENGNEQFIKVEIIGNITDNPELLVHLVT